MEQNLAGAYREKDFRCFSGVTGDDLVDDGWWWEHDFDEDCELFGSKLSINR